MAAGAPLDLLRGRALARRSGAGRRHLPNTAVRCRGASLGQTAQPSAASCLIGTRRPGGVRPPAAPHGQPDLDSSDAAVQIARHHEAPTGSELDVELVTTGRPALAQPIDDVCRVRVGRQEVRPRVELVGHRRGAEGGASTGRGHAQDAGKRLAQRNRMATLPGRNSGHRRSVGRLRRGRSVDQWLYAIDHVGLPSAPSSWGGADGGLRRACKSSLSSNSSDGISPRAKPTRRISSGSSGPACIGEEDRGEAGKPSARLAAQTLRRWQARSACRRGRQLSRRA